LPPAPTRIPFCRRCAYRDFCWGDDLEELEEA
jgi:CRISPR/Cas system-associated exonuclease Cas4 (RecB family)